MDRKESIELENIIKKVLDDREKESGLSREDHKGHHEYIELKVSEAKKREASIEKVKTTAVGAFVFLVVGTAYKGVEFFVDYFVNLFKGSGGL